MKRTFRNYITRHLVYGIKYTKTTINSQPEKMAEAISKIQNGHSAYKVSKVHGIPQSTLKDHTRVQYTGYNTSFGPSTLLSSEQEELLAQYLIYMPERGLHLTQVMTRRLAGEIIQRAGHQQIHEPSEKWMKKFFTRHPEITIRRSHGLIKPISN
ncbi:hypothetical protein ACF0H5_003847 [Mactra antiquata]